MTRLISAVLFLGGIPAAELNQLPSDQLNRGQTLFENSPKGTACARCHTAGKAGNPVGPDLKALAARMSPHDIAALMLARVKKHVQRVDLQDKSSLPAVLIHMGSDATELWDLSKTPPLRRSVSSTEIASIRPFPDWEHPPREAAYSLDELASIIAYLKYTATGAVKPVRAAEVDIRTRSRSR